MGQTLSTAAALTMYAAMLFPLLIIASGRASRAISWGYLTIILACAVYQTGVFQSGSLAEVEPMGVPIKPPADRCQQVFAALKEAGLTTSTNPTPTSLSADTLARLPAAAQDMIKQCFEENRPSSARSAPPGFDEGDQEPITATQ